MLAVLSLWIARAIERSRMGLGFATIRDDEAAAEASGVPTLRLKLIATALSGTLMGMAGAPFPYYVGYIEPAAAFGLPYAVNAIAMPMIGGTTSWVGPLVGAVLLGTLQQVATVTISSVVNLLLVGVLLVAFVIAAPIGIVGLIQQFLRTAAPTRLNVQSIAIIVIASYCFLVGIAGFIFNLPSLQTANATAAIFGLCGILVGTFYLIASYGLLKLQWWARPVAALAFVSSIAFGAAHIWLDPAARGLGIHAVMIVIALLALWYLQHRDVKVLYKRFASSKLVAA